MKRVCVVGAGQLGSRHLQGLKTASTPMDILVVDPSAESLRVAQARWNEIPARTAHRVDFAQDLTQASGIYDVAIISTNADTRRQALEALLERADTRHVVLEKLLFTRIADYAAVGELLEQRGSKAWVNCPRRAMPFYQRVQETLGVGPVTYCATGAGYGLITTAIHFLDHMVSFAGHSAVTVDCSLLQPVPIPSKRRGFLELHGTLRASTPDGSCGLFSCHAAGTAPLVVEISSSAGRCISRESEGKAWLAAAGDDWRWREVEARLPYQSEMTGPLMEQLFATGRCGLPTYSESAATHLALLVPLGEFLKSNCGLPSDPLPFT